MKALRKMMMAFVAIAALGLTTACEKDNSEPASGNTDGNIVGTWKVDKMTLNGMSMNTDSLNIAILVNSDGTGVVSRPDATLSFAWSQNGTTLTITPTAFGSSFDYTITLLTDTGANIIGTVVPGTDMQGDVSVHMVRIANPGDDPDPNPGDDPGDDPNPGDDPGDDPNPGDDPGDDPNPGETGEFPAGTAWTYSYSNTVTQDNMTITVNLNMNLTFNATAIPTVGPDGQGGGACLALCAGLNAEVVFYQEMKMVPGNYKLVVTSMNLNERSQNGDALAGWWKNADENTLSTCSYEWYDARYVVLGKLVPIG